MNSFRGDEQTHGLRSLAAFGCICDFFWDAWECPNTASKDHGVAAGAPSTFAQLVTSKVQVQPYWLGPLVQSAIVLEANTATNN